MAGKFLPSDASQRLTADDNDVSTVGTTVHEGMWKSWSYEFLAVTASAISFACLVATLHSFDRQPQQEWSYHYVTRNTVIAAISTVTRASLLATVAVSLSQNKWTWFSPSNRRGRKLQELETFDNASRGVSGSFQLLGAVKHNHIASLGALVTILALGFDTFAQNILGLENHPVLHPDGVGVGTIPRSEMYTASNHIQDWFTYDLNFDLKTAISNGILGGSNPIPLPACPTGNCSWPVVPSLAMCGECTDVTETITKESRGYVSLYHLPDGTSMLGPEAGVSMTHLPDLPLNLFHVGIPPYGQVYRDILGTTGRIYTSRFSTINTWISEITPEDSLVATECALWLCMRAYNTSVRTGVRNETLISEWDVATPFDPAQFVGAGSMGGRNFTNIPSEFNIGDAMVFGTTNDFVRSINSSISQQIVGNATYSGHYGAFAYDSDNVQSLWNARKDLDAWTKNLAMAMTNVIRTNGTTVDVADSDLRYAGTATSMETLIRVRWVWLVYPAAMLLLGWIHFMVTVWQAAKGATLTWKGTPIMPLLLTVESDDGGTECIHSDGQLLKEVRDRRVVLRVEDKKGWHFSNAM